MWLTRVSVNNPYFAAVLMIALTVLGLFAWQRLAVEEFPDIRFPVAAVTTSYPGASPEVVESEVSRPLEEAINTIAGIKHIRSYSMQGMSTLVVEFELSTDPNLATQEVRDRVSGVQGSFRREIHTPAVSQFNPNDEPLLSISFNSKDVSARALTGWVDNTLKKRLQTVSGVGEVKVVGGVRREIRIDVDPLQLEALGLSLPEVADAIRAANRDYPGGQLTRGSSELSLRLAGKLKGADDFASLIVARRDGGDVRLADVAEVRDGEAEKTSVALIDGAPGVGVDVRAARGANIVEVADGVKKVLAALKGGMPAGTQVTISSDKSLDVKNSLADVQKTLFEGAALTVLIVFLFLGSWRSTVITGLTLPISLIGTMFAIWALGFTLNLMTLMALSLSIGLLIDDAIVVRENIVRHAAMGKSHFQAALDGTNEIGLAVLATTLTVVAVFLPVGFMEGVIGKFFHQFGLTVTVAVLISMLVSFTLDPMLSSIWHDPHHHGDQHKGPLGRMLDWFESSLDRLAGAYVRLIRLALAWRKSVLLLALSALVGSFMLVPLIGGEFLPRADKGEFVVVLKTAPGATLAYTEGKAREVETRLRHIPEVKSIAVKIAGGRFGAGKTEARLTVDVGNKAGRTRSLESLMDAARLAAAGVAGIEVDAVSASGQHGGGGKPLNVGVRGGNIAELEATAAQLVKKIAAIPGVSDVQSSLAEADPGLRISLERDAAAGLGVDLARVGETLSTLLAGSTVTTWEAPDGENYDVTLQVPQPERQRELLDVLSVAGSNDADGARQMVPLSALTRIEPESSPRQIERVDMLREVGVSANISGRSPAAVFADLDKVLADGSLPPGITLSQQGEKQDMQESLSYAVQALALGVIFIYMILAAQFRSFTLPVTIMVSLPLAFVGVFVALWLWGSTLNMFSVIGIVMLMGLAAKNGILLVDFIGQSRREGMSRLDAIVEAGRVRLRPIMMTSLAMIFGMLPLALSSGEGSETQRPMAQAIIGGMVTSTLLTLIVVPVVYTYLDGLRTRLHRLLAGKSKPQADT
ncbi:efflux RND transporter permease subunit [Craterilacuibacter sinensis]|uniref:AcrB/AcrD/AcrF family protein n=1 Tax=Craterilacuibacter sinensis TaxID=2686017 RepID=A0A845BH69_9NEIS|nr:efflux RND transporter permease subunit [Craterilacuibacter sinensis]MXR35645.1 AcrB/AcrD/AcrF family protein [Craterilacuibacter sinensis]